jgi:glycine/D-amino acid oxidase-like deaminating enzyme
MVAIDDLKGGLWVPGDGVGDPYKFSEVLIQLARAKGNYSREHSEGTKLFELIEFL